MIRSPIGESRALSRRYAIEQARLLTHRPATSGMAATRGRGSVVQAPSSPQIVRTSSRNTETNVKRRKAFLQVSGLGRRPHRPSNGVPGSLIIPGSRVRAPPAPQEKIAVRASQSRGGVETVSDGVQVVVEQAGVDVQGRRRAEKSAKVVTRLFRPMMNCRCDRLRQALRADRPGSTGSHARNLRRRPALDPGAMAPLRVARRPARPQDVGNSRSRSGDLLHVHPCSER